MICRRSSSRRGSAPGFAAGGRLGVGIIGPPHQGVHADQRPIADAKRIFLKAEEDVTPEEVAGQHVAAEATTRGAWRVAYRCNRGVPGNGAPSSARVPPTPRAIAGSAR